MSKREVINYVHSNKLIYNFLAVFCCGVFALFGILINLNRFWQYETGYYDFGIFASAIWKISRFQAPIIDHFLIPGKWIFADHFNPTIFLLTPVYWLTSRIEAILIVQDFAVAISGWLLYRIGLKLLKNPILSFCVLVSYFLFVGLQNAIFSDFHELTLMTLPLMLVYWAIVNNHKRRYWFFLLLVLGCKESLFLLGVGIGVLIFFYKKDWRKIAIMTMIVSILWGMITIKYVIPYFSQGGYNYAPKFPINISQLITGLTQPAIKLQTTFLIFASFSFLPLLFPQGLPIIIMNLVSRFLSEGPIRWDLGLHYNAEIAPTLAVSTLFGLLLIKQRFGNRFAVIFSVMLVAISFGLYRFILHGPFGLAYHPAFYNNTNNFKYLDKLVKTIPKNVSVVTQNNLAANFLQQPVYILREDYKKHKAKYILFDLRPGQNPTNFLGIKDVNRLLITVKNDQDYYLQYQDKEQYIFKRK